MPEIYSEVLKCKPKLANTATKILVIACIFTIMFYVYGSIQLTWLQFPVKEFPSTNVELDNELKHQVDEIYSKHWNLFSGIQVDKINDTVKSRTHSSIADEGSQTHNDSGFVLLSQTAKVFGLTEKAKLDFEPTSTPKTTTVEDEITTGFTIIYDETTPREIELTNDTNLVTTEDPDEFTMPDSAVSENTTPITTTTKKHPNKKMHEKNIETTAKKVQKDPDRYSTVVHVFNPQDKARNKMRKDVGEIFSKRRRNLRNYCGPNKGWMWSDAMQMLAVPERDFVVCTVQKAGSTSWHKLVHDMRFPDQQWDGLRIKNWQYATELDKSTRRRLIHSKNSVRVITVRHPFARLVSAWNNKFHKDYVQQNGNKMMNSMPGLKAYVQKHPPDKDHVIAFEDLAQYVADVGLDEVDVHLKSISELCSPCMFPYDYIIKAETAPEDSWFVTEKMNATLNSFSRHVPSSVNLPVKGTTTAEERQTDEARVISRLFRKLPRATTRVLKQLYANDFDAFGYTFDISTLLAGGLA
uniref:carbohydrate sulfotransferase 11-like n=1 Tax=Styela clava TaxID=7725 RepID=UPI00193A2047|nr:carbohydrate sulfotransferase 11-like [Styela clava]